MFENILGNDKIKDMLKLSIKNNKVSHSYLFVGMSGIGKQMIAKEFAKAILCLSEDKYCNKCKSCIEFDSNNNPDFFCIEPDGNSIKIDMIRELQKSIQEKPIISSRKVYIINDADKMTKDAQNCLLKTLEEPPEFASIILVGKNENEFLATIKSRCMILRFSPIDDEQMKNYLSKNHNMQVSSSQLDLFQGSIGKAISLKDKRDEYLKIEDLIENIANKNIIDIVKQAEILYKSKDEIFEMLDYINIILLKKAKEDERYTNCIKIVENTKRRLNQNANYDMSIDNMLFNMWEEID